MKLSRHFTYTEATRSDYATEQGFDNTPNREELVALTALCVAVLDTVRDYLGRRVDVTNMFRADRINRGVGGKPNSQHRKGEAADIFCAGLSPAELAAAIIASGADFDQIVVYPHKGVVHVSYKRAGGNRGEVWTKTPQGTAPGLPVPQ